MHSDHQSFSWRPSHLDQPILLLLLSTPLPSAPKERPPLFPSSSSSARCCR